MNFPRILSEIIFIVFKDSEKLCNRKRTWSIFFVFLPREEATRQWRKRESEWEKERLAREKLMKAVSDAIVLHAERRVKTIGLFTAQ